MGPRLESIASNKATIYIILALCLSLRLAYAWHSRSLIETSDAAAYISIGHNLADGKGFVWNHGVGENKPTAYGNPVYPFLLSLVFRLPGSGNLAVYVLQAILDTLTCLLVFKIASALVAGRASAALAALGYAVYLPVILCVGTTLTECTAFFLTAASLYLLMRALRGSVGQFAVAGLPMGLLMLLKPAMLLFPLFAALMIFLWRKQTTNWLSKVVVYVVLGYAVVAPWTIRNYVVMHAFIPVGSHGEATFWIGTGPIDGRTIVVLGQPLYTSDMPRPKDPSAIMVSKETYYRVARLRAQLRSADEIEAGRLYAAAAKENILKRPGTFAFLAVKKIFRLWFNLWNDNAPSKASMGLAFMNAVLIVLAVLGSRRGAADKTLVSATLWLAIYTTLISMLSMSTVRYSYPIFPFIMVLAAAGVCSLLGIKAATKPDAAEKATV